MYNPPLASKVSESGEVKEGGSKILAVSGFRVFSSGYSDFCQNATNLNAQPNSAFTPRIQSNSANDDVGTGVGWEIIKIWGWDDNGDYIDRNFNLDGTNFANASGTIRSIYWPATVPQLAGIVESNFGDIIVDDGSSNTLAGADQSTNGFQACRIKCPPFHVLTPLAVTIQGSPSINWKLEYNDEGTSEWAVLAQGVTGFEIPVPNITFTENTELRVTGNDLSAIGYNTGATLYFKLTRPRT